MNWIKILILILLINNNYCHAQIYGCTDMSANNYNPAATVNDGTCLYNASSVAAAATWTLPGSLIETSGLTQLNQKIWTHNDNSDLNLYELDTADINNVQSYTLTGTSNIDWEEVTRDSTYFYIGDFGNNANGNRTNLKILRIEINSVLANNPVIDTIYFSYSLQTNFNPTGANNTNFDCEAFTVTNDSIYLFTKEWISQQTSVYSLPKVPGTHIAQYQYSFNVQGLITGATFIESMRLILLCGYNNLVQPFLYLLYDFDSTQFFSGNKRKITLSLPFHQVEGITTENGMTVFVSNEKLVQGPITVNQKLHRLDLSAYLIHYLDSTLVNTVSLSSEFVRLYPNPSENSITINAEESELGKRFLIISSGGNVVGEGIFTDLNMTIRIDQLNSATYYLVSENRNMILGKFIKH